MSDSTSTHTTHSESSEILGLNIWRLVAVAAVAGIGVGFVGGAFHWTLVRGSERFSALLEHWKVDGFYGVPGWIGAALIAGICIGIARWLVYFAPSAAGSGVQHVEAVMRKEADPAPLRVLPIKFFGGLLAMVPGMALGREGPTIQMAAVIGSQCGRIFRLSKEDGFLLYTAVAGAGLSVAFNAPMAGIAFVLEEVTRKITTRSVLITLIAVATSITVFRALFGNAISFSIPNLIAPELANLILYAVLGLIVGLIGALYNRNILLGLNLFSSVLPNTPAALKAAMVGAAVGLIAYWQPSWVGGGDLQAQQILTNNVGAQALLTLLIVRWLLGSISYSPSLPGGLFAPLLLLGAIIGSLFAQLINFFPDLVFQADTVSFALVGMAAFFTAVVRAPFTGVLLIIEMSGGVILTPGLLVACVCATLITSYMGSPPIYDSLRARMFSR
ncbi:MAG: hypothetical protein B7Y05_03615 [Polynucleobacter sp. 24-46-87]|jgi:CIC family chloride channel protein|nr:MAG: hypothetical protein B7Y22_00425 [Polynucleobacter sp. 16-46-70]OZA15513.1 MAG: hypothetical protein B7Y05_03615 [Polynucleobacter sp. 24-46-87]OZA42042.1 MAG: hypothetical protein B7X83_00530 [Polynucleobacter sp. 17-46-58]OZB49506.1 MAG: hypothetical protein B7X60_00995 [Polynucleobacter sp. 39-45-136]HQR84473.1 ClC family H(+)/Cl(-) exchange transporter [Polynucleobacter sp.]